MANKVFILYLFSSGGILGITFCSVDIIRRIKRCRPAIEVFLSHRYTAGEQMVENNWPQTEWAARKGAKEKWEERHGQFEGGCTHSVSDNRGGGNTQQSRVSSDIVGLSAMSSFTQSCCSAPAYLDWVPPASHRPRREGGCGKNSFLFPPQLVGMIRKESQGEHWRMVWLERRTLMTVPSHSRKLYSPVNLQFQYRVV